MKLDTDKSERWSLTIFALAEPNKPIDTRVTTGTFPEVLNGVMLLAADMEDNAVRMVREGEHGTLEVFRRGGFVQVREVAVDHERAHYSATEAGENVDAAEWGRMYYSEGGNRDMLASDLAFSRVDVGNPYAPPEDIAEALAAFDAEYARDVKAQRPEGERDMTEAEFIEAQAKLIG